MLITPIAYARNGFTAKFGIPRQVSEETTLLTRIVLLPPYNQPEALRGIESFTHLWLVWEFDEVSAHREQKPPSAVPSVSLTVRPPRLGGNKRMGVFATRSPFRPNPLGLTSVRLVRVEQSATEGMVLVVAGADMRDGTPIYDIKPYLRYCDSHPEARDGFVDEVVKPQLTVKWTEVQLQDMPEDCPVYEIEEVLSGDPRPAYQQDEQRIYGLDYAGWSIRFRVENGCAYIVDCRKMQV